MNIGLPIVAGRMVLETLGSLAKSVQATASTPTSDRPVSTGTDQADQLAGLRDLAADYDLEWISPKEFAQLVQQLYQLGVLNGEQFRELAVLRLQWDAEGLDPDRPIDVLEHCAEQLKLLRESASNDGDLAGDAASAENTAPSQFGANTDLQLSALSVAERQFQSLQRIAWLLANPDRAGLDRVA